MFREGLTEKVIFQQRLAEGERKSLVGTRGKGVLGRGNSQYEALEAGMRLSRDRGRRLGDGLEWSEWWGERRAMGDHIV